MKLYVIYDRAAEECGPVFEAKNDAVAQRGYVQAMMKSLAGSAEEFWLFYIGEIDQHTMDIKAGERRRVEISADKLRSKDGE